MKSTLQNLRRQALFVESLEDRRMLANCVVTNFLDAGSPVSLRGCVAQAGDGDIITFANGVHTITLDNDQGPIDIPDDIIIMDMNPAPPDRSSSSGPTFTPDITVDGAGMTRIFNVDDGSSLTTASVLIEGLILTGGNGTDGDPMVADTDDGYGGAIISREQLTLSNVVLTGNSAAKSGGALLQKSGSLTIEDASISNNTAAKGGGLQASTKQPTPSPAESAASSGSLALIIDSATIANNLATDSVQRAVGGGIVLEGTGVIDITASTITGNTAVGMNQDPVPSSGGGLYIYGDSAGMGTLSVNIELTDIDGNEAYQGGGFTTRGNDSTLVEVDAMEVSLDSNSASTGGAVFNFAPASVPHQSRLTFENSSLSDNYATNVAAGIFNTYGGRVTLESSTVASNTSVGSAAGIANIGLSLANVNSHNPVAIINNSTISGNDSSDGGGGIYSYDGHLHLFQSTVSGNSAYARGGGIALATNVLYVGTPQEGTTDIQSSTVTNNNAPYGGGIDTSVHHNAFTLGNSIVAANTASMYAPDINDQSPGTPVSISYSLIGDNTGTGLIENGGIPDPSGNKIGSSFNLLDPMLGPLANNGGRTLTHVPAATSPAVDAGNTTIVGGTDQRGFTRVVGGTVDMGSTEFGAAMLELADFDDNDVADCADVDALTAVVAGGSNDINFDLNGDAVVDQNDIVEWLSLSGARQEHAAATNGNPFLLGDANLDGIVDGQDFLSWNANKFTANSAWCSGNFNGDLSIDGQDFLVWNGNKFLSSDIQTPPKHESIAVNQNRTPSFELDQQKQGIPLTIQPTSGSIHDFAKREEQMEKRRREAINDVVIADSAFSFMGSSLPSRF